MMFRYTFARADVAERIERAVRAVLRQGLRTADIAAPGEPAIGTRAMGDAVVAALPAAARVTRVRIAVMHAILAGTALTVAAALPRGGGRHARGSRRAARPRSRRSRRPDRSPRPAVAPASGTRGQTRMRGRTSQGDRNASRIRRLARDGRVGAHAAHAARSATSISSNPCSSRRRAPGARAPRSASAAPPLERRDRPRGARGARRDRHLPGRRLHEATSSRSFAPRAGTATGSTPPPRCGWRTTR